MATMSQIAELAGVSRGTVDRVLNNRGNVSPVTADKIRQIAQSLHYTPSKAARSLAALKHTIKIGFIMPLELPTFYNLVMEGVDAKARELEEYGVTVLKRKVSITDLHEQISAIHELVDDGIAGLVVCGLNDAEISDRILQLTKTGFPVVTSNADMPDCGRLAYVGSNAYREGRTVGQLLSQLTPKKKSLMIVRGFDDAFCCSERRRGLLDFLSENDYPISISRDIVCSTDDFVSYSIIKDTYKTNAAINAIYFTSGGVYGACRALETIPATDRPILICHDCTPQNVEMLKKDIISVIIGQQPFTQGAQPLEILFDWIGMGFKPIREFFYTNISLNIKENVSLY